MYNSENYSNLHKLEKKSQNKNFESIAQPCSTLQSMESMWTEHSGQRYHVLGIELSDPALVDRTKRVVQACVALVAILIIRGVLLLAIGEPVGSTLVSLLFNFSIPAFGYVGARDGSSLLMCIFVGLMVLNAGNAIAVLVIISHAAITNAPQRLPSGVSQPFKMTASVWIQVVLIGAWALMALVGAYHAYKLFSHLSRGELTRRSEDMEVGLPQMEIGSSGMEPESFGLPSGAGELHERDIDDEIHSPIRRKKVEGTEMRNLKASAGSPRE